MTVCATWKQADADHFNGLCTNRFRLTTPPVGVKVHGGCTLCMNPGAFVDVCNPCAKVPFTFETTAMDLTQRSWPTTCFSGCGAYPTTALKTIADIIALRMTFVNKCFWESKRMTVASGCGCVYNGVGAGPAQTVYFVVKKTVQASGGTPVIFQYHTWIATTVDGDPAYMGSGGLLFSSRIGHRVSVPRLTDPRCYMNAMTLTHTSNIDDSNPPGSDLTVGYITERNNLGNFGTVTLRGVPE